MATSLRHATHPLQLGAIEVICTDNLGIASFDTLFAFLKVIAVVPFIGVYGAVVNLDDFITNIVKEVAIVSYHKQRGSAAREIILKPLNKGEVEMVGGLIEDEHIGVTNEHISQGHTLELSARECLYLLMIIGNMQ